MEATNLGCCKLSWGSSISKYLTVHRTQRHMVRRRCECGDQKDRWGNLVDESMIVLRWRIKEMKRLEANEEAPYDWFECEKQYYGDYDQHVFQTMELLQCYLMGLRPSVALGMLVDPYSFECDHEFRGGLLSCPSDSKEPHPILLWLKVIRPMLKGLIY